MNNESALILTIALFTIIPYIIGLFFYNEGSPLEVWLMGILVELSIIMVIAISYIVFTLLKDLP